ncbi:MAG: flagellar biosynthesis protein FlhB [Phycisphaerales bacterium]|jgi:flagellar biosynthesis protein FlhB|nr:flagellar biosynthesis protein FlhB [Phycisphaerales bacterium]
MAEKSASERTEEATPQRIKKSRQEGQIAQSQDVPSAMILGALVLTLFLTAAQSYQWFVLQMREGLVFSLDAPLSNQVFGDVMYARGMQCFVVLLPFLLALTAASIAGSLLVAGWAYSPKAIRLDLSRISPIKGMKNLISMKSIVKLLTAIAKMAVFLTVAWQYMGGQLDTLVALHWSSPTETLLGAAQLVVGLSIRIVVALIVIASVDLLYQRFNHKKQLRMTKQEIKEEHKQREGSGETKGRVRSLQLTMAQKRTLREVPDADVVVVNPSHYAVAIRYDSDSMGAPQVVAKGADFMCETIKEIARANDVPIIEKPELARALYAASEPGEVIPETLFIAVAEILATIYRMKKNKPPTSKNTNK